MQTHLSEQVKKEVSLNVTITNLEKAKTTLQKAPASLKSIVDDAIREVGRAPLKEMGESIDEMNEKLKAATEEFSAAGAELGTKARGAKEDMEGAMQEALELGKTIGKLVQFNLLYRFMVEGEGQQNDVVSQSVMYLLQLDNWQLKYIDDRRKRLDLARLIKEMKEKWASQKEG